MKINIYNLLILSIVITASHACNKQSSQIKNESIAIITKLYNTASIGLPPPPPPEKGVPIDHLPKLKKDTIYDSDQKIIKSIYAITFDGDTGFQKLNLHEEMNDTIVFNIHELANIQLKDRDGNPIHIVAIDERIDLIKEKYDVMGVLRFSNIIFNKTLDSAMLSFKVKRHGLDAASMIMSLKKIKGNWNIIEKKVLYIS